MQIESTSVDPLGVTPLRFQFQASRLGTISSSAFQMKLLSMPLVSSLTAFHRASSTYISSRRSNADVLMPWIQASGQPILFGQSAIGVSSSSRQTLAIDLTLPFPLLVRNPNCTSELYMKSYILSLLTRYSLLIVRSIKLLSYTKCRQRKNLSFMNLQHSLRPQADTSQISPLLRLNLL